MKTPTEWIEIYINTPNYGIMLMVEEVQKEVYNEAIDDATENAKVIEYQHVALKSYKVDKDSILKLKK